MNKPIHQKLSAHPILGIDGTSCLIYIVPISLVQSHKNYLPKSLLRDRAFTKGDFEIDSEAINLRFAACDRLATAISY
jgi:hypothetical protein